jgi:hypothetical protein
VFNEKPSTEVAQVEEGEDEDHPDALPRGAVIHTTRGDISVKLFPTECPRTVQNFATHARDGYYSGVLFHRVIKGFCIQTGDPLGNPPPPFLFLLVVIACNVSSIAQNSLKEEKRRYVGCISESCP